MVVEEEFSIVIPAKDEAENLRLFLPELVRLYPKAEIIVVNDGSSDDTAVFAETCGCKVISHTYSKGNGASIKAGVREAGNDTVVLMDGDGQHKPVDVIRLLEKYNEENADMVVGARSRKSQASAGRLLANGFYNRLSSWIASSKIEDLTSGFRVIRREKFIRFLYLLPNGFSYPTTITMAFFRAGYVVLYERIEAGSRIGKSHVNLMKDGIRFLLIIFKIGTLYSPLKIFFPISCGFFLTGVLYYAYTFLVSHSFTNMGAVLFVSSIIVFLIGLVSEQITMLIYKDS